MISRWEMRLLTFYCSLPTSALRGAERHVCTLCVPVDFLCRITYLPRDRYSSSSHQTLVPRRMIILHYNACQLEYVHQNPEVRSHHTILLQ